MRMLFMEQLFKPLFVTYRFIFDDTAFLAKEIYTGLMGVFRFLLLEVQFNGLLYHNRFRDAFALAIGI